jgi:hypothetical protein
MITLIQKSTAGLAAAFLIVSSTVPAHAALNVQQSVTIGTVTANAIGVAETLAVTIKNVSDNATVTAVSFPSGSGLASSGQYLEVAFQSNTIGASVIISTDNRAADAVPRFASGATDNFDSTTGVSGAGMVGTATFGHGFVVPLLWVVFDSTQSGGHSFTGNLVLEGVVTDKAQTHAFAGPNGALIAQPFDSAENLGYASIISGMVQEGSANKGLIASYPVDADGNDNGNDDGLRPATSPVVVYLGTNYTGAPAQGYATNKLKLELIHQ